jgi:hypothetical protein
MAKEPNFECVNFYTAMAYLGTRVRLRDNAFIDYFNNPKYLSMTKTNLDTAWSMRPALVKTYFISAKQ